MKTWMKVALAAPLAACVSSDVDPKFSDLRHGAAHGYPELARALAAASPDCILPPEKWEPVFVANKITTSRRVTNALQSMKDNRQIIWFQDKRTIVVNEPFCAGGPKPAK